MTLAVEPQAAVSKDQDELPVATGLPWTWDEIAPGHLVIAQTAIQFLERWRQAHVYAELRALEQLDETVAECIGAAAEDGISADDLEKAAGGSLKEYLRTAIINTSE